MNKYLKKSLSVVLIFAMLFTIPVFSDTNPSTPTLDGTQSDWAKDELLEAYQYNLTYPDVMKNFKAKITREEFCILAVKLYEALSGKKALPGENPFNDTKNEEILKAYNLGIVKGVSANQFAPTNKITRQEICVMIYRALDVSIPALNKDTSGDYNFADIDKIASWAINEVKFAYKNQIMKGIGNNQIGPLQNTTREQAIVLMKRTYENYTDLEKEPEDNAIKEELGIITTSSKPTFSITTEYLKYKGIEENDLVFPNYDERITLKEDSYSTFVDKSISSKHLFKFELNNAPAASKVVWQVSTSPFTGFSDNWKTPIGLVGKGEVSAASGEFLVDFANLKTTSFSLINLNTLNFNLISSQYKPIPQEQKIYYLRAVPVNSLGNPIGDPGDGIAVLYGEKVVDVYSDQVISSSFQLWTPLSSTGTYSGENQDRPIYRSVVSVDPRNNENRLFHFYNLDNNYEKIAVQISSEEFPNTGGQWPNTPNIIYEKEYTLPINTIYTGYPNSVFIDFTKFAVPSAEMKAGEYVNYFIRGIAVKNSAKPGTYEVDYSDPITIEYGYSNFEGWFNTSPYDKVETLKYSLPDLEIIEYVPIKWQANNYFHYYYVYRAPKANEITCYWKNNDTGYVLMPYKLHETYYKQQGIDNALEYETQIIPKVLVEGTKVYFPPPKEEQKSWYQQLYEGIVNFFKDVVSIVKDITNQVSAAYANLKKDLIAFVVDLCPVDALKGPFKTALEGMVNAGLMSLGIPPTLPNFDELSEMSMDYFTEVVLTETGIPQNEWTDDLVEDITNAIIKEVDESTKYADVNPLDVGFLKLDPDYLYQPGYVDIKISNYKTKPSIPGSFDLHVTFEMDYYNKMSALNALNLSTPTNYSYSSDAGFTATSNYREHFEYGLNDYSVDYFQGYKAIYDVFDPKIGIKVPMLMPNTDTTVRVYLNPYSGAEFTRYPDGEYIMDIDFENMYFNNGSKKFTYFNLQGRFPTAEEYLLQGNTIIYLDPKTDYVYEKEAYHKGNDRLQKPVNTKWSK
ncbi:MAG: S-layer homology domain-containing protein [Bacillota bacterium]|nr:S-layer homology domain-containing protein [Bacillota bacterium]